MLKYALYYGRDGARLVGYDNERGKGDHRHFDGRESACLFVSLRKLVADFLADVEAIEPETHVTFESWAGERTADGVRAD